MLRTYGSFAFIVSLLAVAACRRDAPAGGAAADSNPTLTDSAPPGLVSVIRVNEGQRGMIAMARWVLPSDGNAMLVVEDWSSIENEPFFDGMLFASESTGLVVRIDSIWDAAPSPDWSQVAFGAATIIRGGEQDEVPADSFRAAAERLGVSVDAARDAGFPASGMAAMAGLAQLGLMDAATGSERLLPLLAGWRVMWSGTDAPSSPGAGPAARTMTIRRRAGSPPSRRRERWWGRSSRIRHLHPPGRWGPPSTCRSTPTRAAWRSRWREGRW